MNLEKILAENMIRFGTKNLTEQLKSKLIEQATQTIDTTGENSADAYGPADLTFKLLGKTPLPQRILNVQKRDPEKSLNIENELKSIIEYTDFITHLTNEKNSESAIIWFLKLTQESRKQFLDQFKQQKTELDPKLEYSIFLSKGKVTTTVTPIPATIFPPFSVGVNKAGNDVFIDNKSDITPVIQQQIEDLIADVKDQMSNLVNTDVKLSVNSFTIGASASRFRNTEEAANLTWAQLSSKRSETVTLEIKRRLEELGVEFPDNVITVKSGFNGDGTSGPNPGFTTDGKPYTISADGTFNNIINNPTAEQRNQFGAPLASKDQYDQYKWLVVDCTIIAVDKTNPIPSEKVEAIGEYNMLIKQFKKPGQMKLPKSKPKKTEELKTGTRSTKGKATLTKCATFDTNLKVDEWWKRLDKGMQ